MKKNSNPIVVRCLTITFALAAMLLGQVGLGLMTASTSGIATCSADDFGIKVTPKTEEKPKEEAKLKPSSSTQEERWEVLEMGGSRIGYSHSRQQEEIRDGQKIIHSLSDMHMTIRRFGQELRMQVTSNTTETEDGSLISFRVERRNPPAAPVIVTGNVKGRKLETETEVNGRKSKKIDEWNPEIKSPAYQERILALKKFEPGDTFSFKTYLPSQAQVATIKLVAENRKDVDVWGGAKKKLLKLRMTQSILPGVPTYVYADEQGEIYRTDTDLLGQTLTTYTAPVDDALAEIPVGDVDVAVSTLVNLKKPLLKGYETTHAVYKVNLSGGDPMLYFPSEGGQKTERIDNQSLELTVDKIPLPERAQSVEVDKKMDPFLKSSKYLQTDDFRVKKHASDATGARADPAQIARQMERYVLRVLKKKNYSTALASAAEVAKNLEGDCTEHAVLLAAMLRVKNIPSRLVVGLVYIERQQALGGHMWTEAFIDGNWIPLDATLGKGGATAGHIKLATSSFSDETASPSFSFLSLLNVMGKVEIEVVESR